MLLVTDIGNSSISLGLFDRTAPAGEKPALHMIAKISADTRKSADEYTVTLHSLLTAHGFDASCIRAAVISSVVPQLTHTLRDAVGKLCHKTDGTRDIPIRLVGEGMRSGIGLSVEDPSELGSDIVTNAAAAVWLYGAPVITLDFGTATVLAAVNPAKALIGVTISPGLNTSLEGLRTSAAQIPFMELKKPNAVLGRNTVTATQSGIIIGAACMVDGLVERVLYEARLPASTPVVVTGGLAPLVLPACRHKTVYEPHLTLYGLWRVYTVTVEREEKDARVRGRTEQV